MTSEQTVRSSDPTSGQRPVGGRHRVATSRNIPVDTLRGLACILLVTFHVIGDKATAGIHVSDDSVFRYYCDSVQYLRMPLFTFLSGLVYAWRPLSDVTGYPSFMRKKARRLLIPYLIFVPILGITQLVAPGVNGSVSFDPLMWWINSLSPYWFLLSTFWLFALVAFLDSYGLLRSPWIFGGLFATVTAVCLFTRPEEIETLQVGTALTFLPFFLAGVGSVRFHLIPQRPSTAVPVTVVFVILAVLVQFSLNGHLRVFDTRHSLVGIALGIIFPVAFLGWSLKSRFLAWIGGYSSGIYLLHSFAIGFFRAVTNAVGLDSEVPQFIILSIGGLAASILGILVLRRFRVGPLQIGRIALGEKTVK